MTLDISRDSSRRTQLREDNNYIHIMKYMGSKRELLPEIYNSVKDLCPKGSNVLDIFAGTTAVGTYLKQNYDIISNDIQSYSNIIGNALIASSSLPSLPELSKLLVDLKEKYLLNKEHAQNFLKNSLSLSDDFVLINKNEWDDDLRNDYIKFFNSFPSPINGFKTSNDEFHKLFELYLEKNKYKDSIVPYVQTTFLFSEVYFSTRQAIDIDSIKYAIDNIQTNNIVKSILLASLIYAFSYNSSGTGHFAMFRDLKNVKSVEDVFLYRRKDVWSYFEKKLKEIYNFHTFYPERKYIVTNQDYIELLQEKNDNRNIDLIYADPPYSFVHYSRFYHAIESLVKYDYDIPQFKGRYRTDRHQSPFCQKQNVEGAFEILFYLAKENKSNLLLSYSDTGMISIDNIIRIGKRNSFNIEVKEIKYNHSTLGREGHKSNKISEYLIEASK